MCLYTYSNIISDKNEINRFFLEFKLDNWKMVCRSKFYGGGVRYFTVAAAYDRRRPCLLLFSRF